MCRTKPGPRCASHTRAELVSAREALAAAEANGASPFEVMLLRGAVGTAQAAYDATPTGQQEILDRIEAGHRFDERGVYLRQRYQRAVATRTEQVVAEREVKRQAAVDAEVAERGGSPFARPSAPQRAFMAGRTTPAYDRKYHSHAPVARAVSSVFDFTTDLATGDVVQYRDGRWQALGRREGGGWVLGPEERTRVAAVRALLASGPDAPTND